MTVVVIPTGKGIWRSLTNNWNKTSTVCESRNPHMQVYCSQVCGFVKPHLPHMTFQHGEHLSLVLLSYGKQSGLRRCWYCVYTNTCITELCSQDPNSPVWFLFQLDKDFCIVISGEELDCLYLIVLTRSMRWLLTFSAACIYLRRECHLPAW